jgi:hypothetical protein
MLAGQAVRIHDHRDRSYQSWFRSDNRFPARVFGSVLKTLGAAQAGVTSQELVACRQLRAAHDTLEVGEITRQTQVPGLVALATAVRGTVYCHAEELDADDLQLDGVDQLYARVGLRRYRRMWLAKLPGHEVPVGAAVAYRGPLGFNLSFLENRCDLLISPALTDAQVEAVARHLVIRASVAYADFEPGSIPVATTDRAARTLQDGGAQQSGSTSKASGCETASWIGIATSISSTNALSEASGGAVWAAELTSDRLTVPSVNVQTGTTHERRRLVLHGRPARKRATCGQGRSGRLGGTLPSGFLWMHGWHPGRRLRTGCHSRRDQAALLGLGAPRRRSERVATARRAPLS